MSDPTFPAPPGGLPAQSERMDPRACLTTAYAVIPASTLTDIVTMALPRWAGTRVWVQARPLTGLAETFSQYLVEVAPGGGSADPEEDAEVGAVLYVTHGTPTVTIDASDIILQPGSYVYLRPGEAWRLSNEGADKALFYWIRKRWMPARGVSAPLSFVTHENDATTVAMPDTSGRWATTRFVDPADVAHDFHVNIVTFQPGGTIPFPETHVMEHGLTVLSGKGAYRLNQDWVEVTAGDFLWLRAFCPQACYAGGATPFRYLLYKDVNRHAAFGGPWR